MLEGITRLQREFLVDVDSNQSFDQMLEFLLEVTASEYGFIGEILYQGKFDSPWSAVLAAIQAFCRFANVACEASLMFTI